MVYLDVCLVKERSGHTSRLRVNVPFVVSGVRKELYQNRDCNMTRRCVHSRSLMKLAMGHRGMPV